MLTFLFQKLKTYEPALFRAGLIHLLLALVFLILIPLDSRIITGVNAWIKPLKFAISIAIFLWTMGLYLTVLEEKSWFRKIARWSFIVAMVVEMALISMQAARGVISHYNITSAFDGVVFGMMGTFIFYNTAMMAIFVLFLLPRRSAVSLPVQVSMIAGLLISLFGSWMGTEMVSQMAHSVGTPDGGAGLFFVNWSITHGDLRVAHFFGLHALQLLPVIAWITHRYWSQAVSILVLILLSLAYLAFVAAVYFQAKAGMPFIAG